MCVCLESCFTYVCDRQSRSITNKEVIAAMIWLCEVKVINIIGNVVGCSWVHYPIWGIEWGCMSSMGSRWTIVSQNLLSFSSLCKTNPISVEFFSNHFLVKDLKTRVPILKRLHRDGLYHMPYLPKSPTTYIMTSPSHKAQHNIYWHSSDRILRHLASHHQIRSSTTTPCISCSSSKSHKLPFTISSVVTTKLLELVYVDAWGLLLRGL